MFMVEDSKRWKSVNEYIDSYLVDTKMVRYKVYWKLTFDYMRSFSPSVMEGNSNTMFLSCKVQNFQSE